MAVEKGGGGGGGGGGDATHESCSSCFSYNLLRLMHIMASRCFFAAEKLFASFTSFSTMRCTCSSLLAIVSLESRNFAMAACVVSPPPETPPVTVNARATHTRAWSARVQQCWQQRPSRAEGYGV